MEASFSHLEEGEKPSKKRRERVILKWRSVSWGNRASLMALVVKNLPANAGDIRDAASIPGLGRSPEREYGNPLQYSCLENPMDRGAWQSTVHRVTKSQTPWSYLACRCASWGSIKYINQVKGHNVKSLQWKLGLGIWSLSCLTLCDPMDYSLPGSSVHGIFQARVLEWIAISFSRGSSRPRDRTRVSRIVDRCFTVWATREVLYKNMLCYAMLSHFSRVRLCVTP